MASLFESLAVTGSRKADGTANASGRCWFYVPGTQTVATIYPDAEQSAPLSNPVTLNAGGKATVYFAGQVDVFIEDSARLPISTLTLSERAERVEVRNAGFTGLLPSGSQGAGGATDLDTVLSSIFASVGGLDGQYKEFAGATSRSIADKFREVWVSVKDYGAKGDGVRDDTTSIRTTANEAARLGGAIVYFPPGTYLVSSPILLSSATGVSFVGAGRTASLIKSTSTTENVFTLTSCSGFTVRDLGITAAATNSGTAIAMSGCSSVSIRSITVDGTGGGKFLICASLGGAASKTMFFDCALTAKAADVTARGIAYSATSGSVHSIIGCTIDGGTGQPINFDLAITQVVMAGCNLAGSLTFAATLTGSGFNITGNYFAANVTVSATADISLAQSGNRWVPQILTFANGTTQTPQVLGGYSHLSCTSGGAGTVTVNAPSPPVIGNSGDRAPFYIVFTNAAGGAVTWALAGTYKLSAAVPTTDGHSITVGFMPDIEGSVYREFSRADTTT